MTLYYICIVHFNVSTQDCISAADSARQVSGKGTAKMLNSNNELGASAGAT